MFPFPKRSDERYDWLMETTTETTARTIVYGASDDLLELDGTISEEFDNDQEDGRIVGFSHGVLLRVTCDGDGCWRIAPLRGQEHVEIVFARGEDDGGRDDDGCPGYSDKAIVTGDHDWALVGTAWEPRR